MFAFIATATLGLIISRLFVFRWWNHYRNQASHIEYLERRLKELESIPHVDELHVEALREAGWTFVSLVQAMRLARYHSSQENDRILESSAQRAVAMEARLTKVLADLESRFPRIRQLDTGIGVASISEDRLVGLPGISSKKGLLESRLVHKRPSNGRMRVHIHHDHSGGMVYEENASVS